MNKKSFEIKFCRICGKKVVPFFNLGEQPLANSLNVNRNIKEVKYPLKLVFCKNCSTVQLSETVNKNLLFKKYIWNTSISSTAKKFSKIFFEKSEKILNLNKKKKNNYILEIASNDGTFLLPFFKKGYKVLGIDPAINIAKIASKKGIKTITDFFNIKSAKKILTENGPPLFIFARNVIPHSENVNEVISAISRIMNKTSIGAIEFHYSANILNKRQYDSIYHEHIFYFSLKNIEYLLNKHNLYIFHSMTSEISGGSLIIYFSKKKKGSTKVLKLLRNEKKNKINNLLSWRKFANDSQEHKKQFLKILAICKNQYKKIIGYGASARSSTFLNFCNLSSKDLKLILDKSKLKKNMFTPGAKIKILHPQNVLKYKPDLIIILAWNFFKEITVYLKFNLNYKGDFLVTFPKPQIFKNYEIL